MTKNGIFLFNLVNFALLLCFLAWGTRRLAKRFFHARNIAIKKDTVETAGLLKASRRRLMGAKTFLQQLPSDINHRKSATKSRVREESDEILGNAKKTAAHIVENSIHQGQEERRRVLIAVQKSIIKLTFNKVEKIIAAKSQKEILQDTTNKSVADFFKMLQANKSEASRTFVK